MKSKWCAVGAVAVLAVGCGSDEAPLSDGPSRSSATIQQDPSRTKPQAERLASARFTGRSVFGSGTDAMTITIRGAFDWRGNRGWLVETGPGSDREVIQIDERCYRRYAGGGWSAATAKDEDRGLCDVELANPADTLELMYAVASEWDVLEPTRLRGVLVSRYRARLNIGAVKGPFEIWIDDRGRVHRFVQRSEESDDGFVAVTDYSDFGASVDIEPPGPFR